MIEAGGQAMRGTAGLARRGERGVMAWRSQTMTNLRKMITA